MHTYGTSVNAYALHLHTLITYTHTHQQCGGQRLGTRVRASRYEGEHWLGKDIWPMAVAVAKQTEQLLKYIITRPVARTSPFFLVLVMRLHFMYTHLYVLMHLYSFILHAPALYMYTHLVHLKPGNLPPATPSTGKFRWRLNLSFMF